VLSLSHLTSVHPLNLICTSLNPWLLSCPWSIQSSHIPRVKSYIPFLLLRLYQKFIPSPWQLWMFCNVAISYGEGLLACCSTPKLKDYPPVGCPWLLIQYIRSYPSYWMLFLHPQTEDMPCHGDRNPSQGIPQWTECTCLVGTSAAQEYKKRVYWLCAAMFASFHLEVEYESIPHNTAVYARAWEVTFSMLEYLVGILT
jgi:hypothetical protein